jgi:methylthioribose-1-phosphate isomerase
MPNVEALVDHIHALRVRGAPLIGLSASLLLALLAESGKTATSWRRRWKPCAPRGRRR